LNVARTCPADALVALFVAVLGTIIGYALPVRFLVLRARLAILLFALYVLVAEGAWGWRISPLLAHVSMDHTFRGLDLFAHNFVSVSVKQQR
jgi:hypothetical protein